MPSPACEVKDGSGAYVATDGGVDVTPANTITIRLASQAGIDTWSIACLTTDELSDAAAVSVALVIDQVAKTATFTAPTAGSAYRFQSRINGGIDVNGISQPSYTTTFCVYTLTAGGLRVIAADETTEGDSTFGWLSALNSIIRSPSGGASPAGSDTEIQYKDGAGFGASSDAVVDGDGYLRGKTTIRVQKTGSPSVYASFDVSSLSAARAWAFPDGDGTFVGTTNTQTLTNKTISASSNTITDASAAAGDVLVHNGTKFVRLAKGSNGTFLGVSGGTVGYYTPAGGGASDGSAGAVQLSDGAGGFVGASTISEVAGLPTFSWTETYWFAGGNFLVREYYAWLTSLDAQDTALVKALPTTAGGTFHIEVYATFQNDSDDGFTVKLSAVYKRTGGTVTQLGSDVVTYLGKDAPADPGDYEIWTVASGTDIQVRAYNIEDEIDGSAVGVGVVIRVQEQAGPP